MVDVLVRKKPQSFFDRVHGAPVPPAPQSTPAPTEHVDIDAVIKHTLNRGGPHYFKPSGHQPTSKLFYPGRRDPNGMGFQHEEERTQALVPEQVQTGREFRPCVMLFMGRRGQGKTKSMVMTALMMKRRYAQKRMPFSIFSNFWVEGADRVSPNLIDELMQFPAWARDGLVLIDEASSAFPGRRSLSSVNVEFSQFLTQIRKRNLEVCFTTQFPQVLDYQVLLQVDLFIRCENLGLDVGLGIYDWWGQWTGRDYRKRWPPEVDTQDWNRRYVNAHLVHGLYRTGEVVAPVWSKSRQDIINQQYEREGEAAPVEQIIAPVEPKGLVDYLKTISGPFDLITFIERAKAHMSVKNLNDLADRLRKEGFQVWKAGSKGDTWMGEWKAVAVPR